MDSVFMVTGMTCGHCVSAVRAEIGELPGIRKVRVDLASGTVTVTSDGPADEAAIRAAVAGAGYEIAHRGER